MLRGNKCPQQISRKTSARPKLFVSSARSRTHVLNFYVNIQPSYTNDVRTLAAAPDATLEKVTDKVVISGFTFSFEPFYRLILIYSNWASDKITAEKIRASVPIVTFTEALKVTRTAKVDGKAIIATVIKDDAVAYARNLELRGLQVELDEA